MSWGRNNYEMTLRDVEEGGLRFYEAKGRMNGEQAEPTEVDDLPPDVEEDEDRYPCACRDEFLYGPPDDCPACAGSGFVDAPNEWCDRCGMSGICPDCDPDTYRDAMLDR